MEIVLIQCQLCIKQYDLRDSAFFENYISSADMFKKKTEIVITKGAHFYRRFVKSSNSQLYLVFARKLYKPRWDPLLMLTLRCVKLIYGII